VSDQVPEIKVEVTTEPQPNTDLHMQMTTGRPQVSRTPQQAKDNSRLVRSALAMLLVFGALVAFNIWYTSHTQAVQQQKSDQRFCALFVGLDDRYRVSVPPGSETFAQQVHDLRTSLHCPDTVVLIPSPPPASQE
jgi:hypothetical protein